MRMPFLALLALPLLAQPLWADSCEPLTPAAAVGAIYRDMDEAADSQSLDQLLIRDLDGDGINDMLTVKRVQTEGGAGDAASLTYQRGVPEGVCALGFDISLDAGQGEITVEVQARPNHEAKGLPPDVTVHFQENVTTSDANGIVVTTKPTSQRYRYDTSSFGYVAVQP